MKKSSSSRRSPKTPRSPRSSSKPLDLNLSGLDVDNIRLNLAVVISEQSAQQRVNLTLSNCRLSDEPLEALVHHLAKLRLRRLNLSENMIGPSGLKALLELPKFADLAELDLSNNFLNADCYRWLGNILSSTDCKWRQLNLGGNVGLERVSFIARALKFNTSLKTLKLFENELQDNDAIAIAESLIYNSTLTSLDLSKNQMLTNATLRAFEKAMRDNSTLTEVGLVIDTFMNQNDEKSISTMLLRLSTELRWNKKLRISKKFPKSLKDLIDPTYIAPAYTKKMEFIQRFYRKYEKSANYSGELEGDEKLEEEEGGRKEEELERFLYLFTPDQVIEFCRYLISDHYSIFVNRKSVLTIDKRFERNKVRFVFSESEFVDCRYKDVFDYGILRDLLETFPVENPDAVIEIYIQSANFDVKRMRRVVDCSRFLSEFDYSALRGAILEKQFMAEFNEFLDFNFAETVFELEMGELVEWFRIASYVMSDSLESVLLRGMALRLSALLC